jgi:hypothetical protein
VWVQSLPSTQALPSGLAGLVHTPVAGLHAPTSWHWSLAVQVTVAVGWQVPATQRSPLVHRLPSLQLVPSALAGLEQAPVAGSHPPASCQASLAVQVTVAVGWQAPATQRSPLVHRLPSVQAEPSALAGLEHWPVTGLHTPASWHGSLAVQVTLPVGWQTPATQRSPVVQRLPSLHTCPSALAGLEQTPVDGSHTPASWQASLAVQVTLAPAWQSPAAQVSPVVQAFPSLQPVPESGAWLQWVAAQLSWVQGLPSSQSPSPRHSTQAPCTHLPGWPSQGWPSAMGVALQRPPAQASDRVQGLPSLQPCPSPAAW